MSSHPPADTAKARLSAAKKSIALYAEKALPKQILMQGFTPQEIQQACDEIIRTA